MDSKTERLLEACVLILDGCRISPKSWYFESGSEAHLALVEAVTEISEDRPTDYGREADEENERASDTGALKLNRS